MTNDASENPFQSPASSQPESLIPAPTRFFWGIGGGLLLLCLLIMLPAPGLGILGLMIVVPGLLRGFW